MENIELNHDKLKGKIKEVLGTQSKLAEELDLDETTISNKLNSHNTQKIYCNKQSILFHTFI